MPGKPSVILIGDSICMGYRPHVQKRLSGKVDILGIEGNGGDSSQILKNLDEWMINRDADLIHFNCGLHDLKFERDTKAYQQPLEVYEANLRKIVGRLQGEAKSRLAWATTTPVIDERHNAVKGFDRYLRDVQAYNRVATAIITEAGIPIDDLYSAIQNDDVEACLGNDGVHTTERGNEVLTDTVCSFILRQLGI
jgi:lysophospholipase L1-like esterase